MKALDFSFSAVDVTPTWCAARRADGFELAVCCLWTGNQAIAGAETALRYWREAGGISAGYFAIHDATPLDVHFVRARAAAGQEWERLNFVAVDVEIEPVSTLTVRAACQIVAAASRRPIIYTGKWFWGGKMGNPQECGEWPLWDASYGIAPELGPPFYGAWATRTGHQYQGTTQLDGINVDLSLFDTAWVKDGLAPVDRAGTLQTAIDVTRGWARQMAQASKELADVAEMLEKLKP